MRMLVLSELSIAAAVVVLLLLGRPWWPSAARVAREPSTMRTAVVTWRADPLMHRVALAGILVAAAALRVYHLRVPMRLDESWTYLAYASQPLRTALTSYANPNNHFLHTLLVWLSTRAFGDAEWAIRLPALVCGILLVPAVYVATRALQDRDAGLIAAALASVFPSLILYSTNARGYGILCLCFVALIWLGNAILDEDSWARWVAFATLVALGMYTIPSMLYPAGAVSLWLLLERSRRGGVKGLRTMVPRLAWSLALAALLVAAALAPVGITSVESVLVSHRRVGPLPAREFVAALGPSVRELRGTLGLGLALPAAAALIVLAVCSLRMGPRRERRQTLALAIAAWCAFLVVVTRRPALGRVWLFLVPACCILAASGLSILLERTARGFIAPRSVRTSVAAFLLIALIGGDTLRRQSILESTETGAFRDGPEIARRLAIELRPGDRIAVTAINATSLDFYLRRLAGKRLADFATLADSGRVYAVVNRQYDQTIDIVRARQRAIPWNRLELDRTLSFSHATIYSFRARRLPAPGTDGRPN